MYALTIQQPWAWAVLQADKSPENRRDRRGQEHARKAFARAAGRPLLIHSGGRYAGVDAYRRVEHLSSVPVPDPGGPGRDTAWAFSAIIGVVDVESVHTASACEDPVTGKLCSPWAEDGAAHLVLTNPRTLYAPVPCPGRLGLWEVTDTTVLATVRRYLS